MRLAERPDLAYAGIGERTGRTAGGWTSADARCASIDADGSELFFRTPESMMVVDMTEPARPGTPRPLWDDPYQRDPTNNSAPNYAVHPDGRFLVVRLDESSRGRVHVILNWVDELRARVPR